MGNILGKIDHLTGESSGSRIGQGLGIPKGAGMGSSGRVPRSVAGPKSYGIRHAQVQKAPTLTEKIAPSSGKLPSIASAPKPIKLGSQL